MTPGEYRRSLDGISSGLAAALLFVMRKMLSAGVSADRKRSLRREIVGSIWLARSRVRELTIEYLRSQAAIQAGLDDVFIPPSRGYAPSSVDSVIDRIEQAIEKSNLSRAQAAEQATSTFVRHAEAEGRDMIWDSVEQSDLFEPDDPVVSILGAKDAGVESSSVTEASQSNLKQAEVAALKARKPVAFARGLTGADNCAFCVMLASRGAVYKSSATAIDGPFTGRSGQPAYHDNCDCIPIPVFTSKKWDGKAEADRLYKMWLSVTSDSYGRAKLNAFRRELDRMKRDGESIAPDIRVAA